MASAYEIVLHPRVERELNQVPPDIFPEIDRVIQGLRGNPRPFGVKKLDKELHRVRIQKWRIIYAIFDREKRIVILRVVRRSERTYKDL